jgi:hypothetical protein
MQPVSGHDPEVVVRVWGNNIKVDIRDVVHD